MRVDAGHAIEAFEKHRKRSGKGLHDYVAAIFPTLPTEIDVSGKVRTGSSWRSLQTGDDHYAAYKES